MIQDNVRAMVLAAGIGSRLQPLSDKVPKPLIKIGGRTVMDHILLLLKHHGITNIISNTHYLADQIHDHFANIKEEQGIDIQFVFEEKLSGVAGGIRACKDFLNQSTACIIMGDALTDIDLTRIYKQHKKAVEESNCICTIAKMQVEDTTQFGVIVSDENNRVKQFQEKPAAEDALSNWANTGVYFFEPRIYDFIPSETEAPIYDVGKDLFPKLLELGEYLQAIEVAQDTYWADLGTPDQYLKSMQDIAAGKIKLDLGEIISSSASIDPSSKLEGVNEIGKNVKIGANTVIKNSIIWDGAKIAPGSNITDSIIGANCSIESEISKVVLA